MAAPHPDDETLESRTDVPHDPYLAFRQANFPLHLGSFLIGVVGMQIQNAALGWELAGREADPQKAAELMAFLGLVEAVPMLVFSLPAGQLADKFNRQRIIMCMQWIAVVCSVVLAWLSHIHSEMVWMYVTVGIQASALSFMRPARGAFLSQIVDQAVLPNAITWNSSTFHLSVVIGPVLAGFLITYSLDQFHSLELAYICTAIGMFLAFAFLFFIKPRPVTHSKEPVSLSTVLAGAHFVFGTPKLLALLTLDLFAVLLGGATYLLPIFAGKQFLDVGPHGYGWLLAAPALGSIVMAISLAHLPPLKRAGDAMLLAVAGFGVATIIFGLSTSFWLSMAMLFLTGALDQISVVVRHTLVQLIVPDELRGRVAAVNNMFIGASNELGGVESGYTAKWFGTVASVVAGGIGTLVVVAATVIKWPQVREIKQLKDVKPEQG